MLKTQLTAKKKQEFLKNSRSYIVRIINLISIGKASDKDKIELVSFLLAFLDIVDIEKERIAYEKIKGGN